MTTDINVALTEADRRIEALGVEPGEAADLARSYLTLARALLDVGDVLGSARPISPHNAGTPDAPLRRVLAAVGMEVNSATASSSAAWGALGAAVTMIELAEGDYEAFARERVVSRRSSASPTRYRSSKAVNATSEPDPDAPWDCYLDCRSMGYGIATNEDAAGSFAAWIASSSDQVEGHILGMSSDGFHLSIEAPNKASVEVVKAALNDWHTELVAKHMRNTESGSGQAG